MAPWFVFVAGDPFGVGAYARFPYLPWAVMMLAFMIAVLQRKAVGESESELALTR